MICSRHLLAITSSKILLRKVVNSSFSVMEYYNLLHGKNTDDDKKKKKNKLSSTHSCRKKQISLFVRQKNIKTIKEILKKYDIDTEGLSDCSKFFEIHPFVIERRIMLLQEFHVPKIKFHYIYKFLSGMNMQVQIFKANTCIDQNHKISKSLFWYLKNPSLQHTNISEMNNLKLKNVYLEALAFYLRHEFNFTDDDLNIFYRKQNYYLLHNSFRLISELLVILRNDLKFSNTFITENRWILNCHPKNVKSVINILRENLIDVFDNIISQYPIILNHDSYDLEKFIILLKKYNIPSLTIAKFSLIFRLNSEVFKKRMQTLLKNPVTSVFANHPRFLILIIYYNTLMTRLDLIYKDTIPKFITVSSLVNYSVDKELNYNVRKPNKFTLHCFLQLEFNNDIDKILEDLVKHPYYSHISLIKMHDTIKYLKQQFSKSIIRKHIYAILYPRSNIQSEYESLSSEDKKLPRHQQLALVIYKLEAKYNFTGEIVLN